MCEGEGKTQGRFLDKKSMAVSYLLFIEPACTRGIRPLSRKACTEVSPLTATVAEALFALKNSDDNFLSVWSCDHTPKTVAGFQGMLMKMNVNVLGSLLEVIDLILQGAQNLVVPIKTRLSSSNSRRKQQQKLLVTTNSPTTIHGGREFCWLTQEDIIRFLLSSIGLFSPIPALSIDSLGIISTDIITTDYHSPAPSAVAAISRCLADQTSVAVVDGDEGILIGELSPLTLACCDETVAAAITTLSCGDLMAYIDCGAPQRTSSG
ncbi:hypothetical protein GH714_025246 [Hevea brasiliensis]|uniref:CBS domain-containing protein n=1 Tax=Hevea brasiliensis TaxID=3981 RepID=A0A6A6MKQ0_HEVBR|nr:hypothetical protein GH714_025246 [Hevea brasiliensis]